MIKKYVILAETDQGTKSLLVKANSKKRAKVLAGIAFLKKGYKNIAILNCKEIDCEE
jgi:hypothetical protein